MKKKKFLSLMLSTSMVLTMVPTTALALESDDVDLKEDEVQISELPVTGNQEINKEEPVAEESAEPDMAEPVNKTDERSLAVNTLAAPIDVVNIPDKEFAKKINSILKQPQDHKITYNDMAKITYLSVNFADENITDLEGIQYAVNLKELYVSRNCENIEKISSLTNLETLKLRNLSNFNLTMLGSMPKLTEINLLYVSNLKNLDGLTIEKTPNLKKLFCMRCSDLVDISALRGQNFPLKEVDLEAANTQDISPLSGYTSITDLYLEAVEINDNNRESYKNTIRTLTGLTTLSMPYCKVTDADVDMFTPLVNLKNLVLNVNNITNTKFFDNLPEDMGIIGLNGNEIENMDNLARFHNLKILGMGSNRVTDFRFMKNFNSLKPDGIRHAEGDDDFRCDEYYSIGDYKNPTYYDDKLIIKNPYIGVDGKPISFENFKTNVAPEVKIQYDKVKNEFIIENLNGYMHLSIYYDIPVSNNKVKKYELHVSAYAYQQQKYRVNYDWGKNAPASVKLPVDNTKYKTIDDAKKAVDKTFTKDTEVKETVDGVKGVWKFSGWKVNASGKLVSCTGNWKFYPDMMVINAVPKITAADKVLTVGDKFNELDGVTATDKEDGKLTDKVVVVENTVDMTKAGTYKVTYKVTDKHGASTQKTINVTVNPKIMVINAAPKITATDKVLTVGDKFNELDGVTASDKEDGKLTDKVVVVDNTVDMTKAGTYKVTYKVTDKQGATTQKTINVTVIPKAEVLNHAPFIEAVDKTLTVGDKFDELDGVTAKDDEDGDLTNQIVVLKNDVDTAKAGTYEVIYKVTDKQGASSIKTITVTVKEKEVVPAKPAKPEAPKTGDANNFGLWGMMLFVSSGIAAMISKKKKLFK